MKNDFKKDVMLESFNQYKIETKIQLAVLGGRHQAHNPECFGYVPD